MYIKLLRLNEFTFMLYLCLVRMYSMYVSMYSMYACKQIFFPEMDNKIEVNWIEFHASVRILNGLVIPWVFVSRMHSCKTLKYRHTYTYRVCVCIHSCRYTQCNTLEYYQISNQCVCVCERVHGATSGDNFVILIALVRTNSECEHFQS